MTHKHVASLEPLPPKWSSIEADGGHWIHPVTREHVKFALVIDQGSRFRAARIMCKGKHKTMNAKLDVPVLPSRRVVSIFRNPTGVTARSCRSF